MKRTLLFGALSLPVLLSAQPVLTYADFPANVGDITSIQLIDYLVAGPATANFNFNASGVTQTTPTQSQYLAPASTPYASYFPTANYASAGLINPQQYGYVNLTATGSINLGFYGPSANLVLTNGEKLMEYPLSMNGTWTDAWTGTGSNAGTPFTRGGNTTGIYNGYGTIQLPFGTFTNVARLQIDQVYSDVIQGQGIDYEVRIISYVKPGISSALFSSTYILYDFGFGMDTLSTYSTMVDPAEVGLDEFAGAAGDVILFPNPATDQVQVLFSDMPSADRLISIIDASGRAVRTANGIPAMRVDLPVADLQRGIYFIRIQEGDGRLRSLPLVLD